MNDIIKLPDFSFLTEYKGINLTMILLSFYIGIIIASVATLYRQLFLGGIVRNILSKKALSPESALSIEDLGYKKNNIFIKYALRDKSTFSKTVHSVKKEDGSRLYYIPEEISVREEIRFRKKGTEVLWLFVVPFVFSLVAFAALTIIPLFSEEIRNIISNLG